MEVINYGIIVYLTSKKNKDRINFRSCNFNFLFLKFTAEANNTNQISNILYDEKHNTSN